VKEKRDVVTNLTLDRTTAKVLTALAEDTEGNKSAALRRLLREVGSQRGLLPVQPAQKEVPQYESA